MKLLYLIVALQLSVVTTTLGANADMAMAILTGKIAQNRKVVLQNNMELTPEQAPLFWNIYAEYELYQKPLLDEAGLIAAQYSDKYSSITEAEADDLARRHFKNDKANLKLREKYYKKVARAISVPVALRFSQIVNRIDLKNKHKITQILPIIEVDTTQAQ